MILSSKFQHNDGWKHVTNVCAQVFSSVSVLGMVMLISVTVVWALEKAPSQTFVNVQNIIHTHVGDRIGLNSNIRVHTDAKKAVYRMWLTDASGESVYVFPDRAVIDPTDFILEPDNIRVPPSIRPGEYQLRAEVIYPFNPFKNGSINMTLATLYVN